MGFKEHLGFLRNTWDFWRTTGIFKEHLGFLRDISSSSWMLIEKGWMENRLRGQVKGSRATVC
jgi:hypothetical protein